MCSIENQLKDQERSGTKMKFVSDVLDALGVKNQYHPFGVFDRCECKVVVKVEHDRAIIWAALDNQEGQSLRLKAGVNRDGTVIIYWLKNSPFIVKS